MRLQACNSTGPLPSAATLAAALTDQDYQSLMAFASRRLARLRAASDQNRLLAMIEPADLVHQALFKVLLGDCGFPAGRHLSPKNRASTQAFIWCLQGIINSDLSALAKRPESRINHLPIGDSSVDPQVVDPAIDQDLERLLQLRDLHNLLFSQLRQAAGQDPALDRLLQQWEQAALSDDRLPTSALPRHYRRKLKARLQRLCRDFARELGASDGKEMIL